mgnify:FL=1
MKKRLLLLTSVFFLALFSAACTSCRQSIQTSVVATLEESATAGIDIPLPLTDRDEQLLYRKAYIVSYNKQTLQPNWVAWHLTGEHTYGDVARPGAAWHDDSEVPQPRVYHRDYSGTPWDRGHMCPAGDNKWDSVAMYESFLLTNACPQSKALNSGIWNQLEMSCREWARRWGDIYIVCGPLFLNQEHDTIGQHRIPVPDAFFKVVADLNPDHPKGIGFICRNNEGTRKRDLYTNTISEVERITGITFFPNLPVDMSQKVKDQSELSEW